MSVLTGDVIFHLQDGYKKKQPAGIDVAPKAIYKIPHEIYDYAIFSGDKRGFVKNEEYVPIQEAIIKVEPKDDYWILEPGVYYVVFPKVKIPKDCIAIAYPRSTLNRLGLIKCQSAIFDPGYEGEYNQTWYLPIKLKIHVNEPWIQLVFFKLDKPAKESYAGHWQGERYE